MFLKNKPALSLRGSIATTAIASLFLLACGDDTTEVIAQSGQNHIGIVAEESDLPECTEDNEGEQVLVKGEVAARTCVDGEWTAVFAPGRDTIYLKSEKMDCYTKELADKQGVKIICDGDSVGVLLNGGTGAQGDKGDKGIDGAGCSLTQLDSVMARLVCGVDTMTVYLGLPPDTTKVEPVAEIDSEKIPVSIDSLVGVVQFGSFSSNTLVQLYGLGDGHALRMSGGTYTSTSDGDGNYKFRGFEFPSQYAMLEVEGKYANMCYYDLSSNPIHLRAIVDLTGRTSANVNVLTEMEFERVNYLVNHEGMATKQAKKQAQSEVFAQFYIDSKDFGASETLNILGESDADAALLAVSILLQTGDGIDGHLMAGVEELAPKLAAVMETTGTWSGEEADARKALIADLVLGVDMTYTRKYIESWKKSGSIGNFEKYIENFIEHVYAMEPCEDGSESEPRVVNNEKSRYHGKVFHCHEGLPTVESKNSFTNPEIDYGWMVDMRDRHAYRTVKIGEQTWMAENLNFNYRTYPYYYSVRYIGKCLKNDCDVYGRGYIWSVVMDSASVNSAYCGGGRLCSPNPSQGVCPQGWHVPDTTELLTLIDAVGGTQNAGRVLKSAGGWINMAGVGENGIDSVGFSLLPTVVVSQESPDEDQILGHVWSATYCSENCVFNGAYYIRVDSQSSFAVGSEGTLGFELPVRCLKD